IVAIREDALDYARKVASELRAHRFRVHLDEPPLADMRERIREAQHRRASYLLVVGGKEAESGTVSVRKRGAGKGEEERGVALAKVFEDRSGRLFVIEHEGRPIGFANYRDWRPKPRSAEIGIGIGESALWSHGLGRDALGVLLRHLVDDLDAHRVSLSVLA